MVSTLKSPRKGGLFMDEEETNESMLQIVNILDSQDVREMDLLDNSISDLTLKSSYISLQQPPRKRDDGTLQQQEVAGATKFTKKFGAPISHNLRSGMQSNRANSL